MLKGASLLYAVFLGAIISALCAILLYVFALSKLHLDKLFIQNDFITDSISCFDTMVLQENWGNIQHDITTQFDKSNCQLSIGKWGLLPLVKQKVYFKRDTLIKTVFSGCRPNSTIAFYKADTGSIVKVTGQTTINGDMQLPSGRVEQANILGNQFINNPIINGTISKSNTSLPNIINTNFDLPSKYEAFNVEDLDSNNRIVHSFDKLPMVVYMGAIASLDSYKLKGNIIVVSDNLIRLTDTSQLEDVVIIGPNVIIQKGFQGNVQVFATENIEVEKNVQLNYPSALVLNAQTVELGSITVGSKSKIYGNVVLNVEGNLDSKKQKNSIKLDSRVSIFGKLYCKGTLEMQRQVTVKGTVFTHALSHKTAYSAYEDVLIDAEIGSLVNDSNYSSIPLLANDSSNLEIIKEL